MKSLFTSLFLTVLSAGTILKAADYDVSWLDLSPTAVESTITSGTTYNLAGYGDVRVSYTPQVIFPVNPTGLYRIQNSGLDGQSISSGGNVYSFVNSVDGINGVFDATGLPTVSYSLTFEFLSGPVAPGSQLALSIYGLGNYTTGSTTVTGNADTSLIGIYDNPSFGSPNYVDNAGSFVMTNSVVPFELGYGNTDFTMLSLDGNVSSLTLTVSQVEQDGIQFNVGIIQPFVPVPEPSGALFLSVAGLITVMRRRRF